MHMIRENKFQMVVYVAVAFHHLAKTIAVFKLQLLRIGIEDSCCNGQIVNQPIDGNYSLFSMVEAFMKFL